MFPSEGLIPSAASRQHLGPGFSGRPSAPQNFFLIPFCIAFYVYIFTNSCVEGGLSVDGSEGATLLGTKFYSILKWILLKMQQFPFLPITRYIIISSWGKPVFFNILLREIRET